MALEIVERNGIFVPTGTHEGKLVVFGADHRGFSLKQALLDYARGNGYEVVDAGTSTQARTSYVRYATVAARPVGTDTSFRTVGVVICGSGNGVATAANKVKGAYASRCLTVKDAESARKHGNANVLALGADVVGLELATQILHAFLTAQFSVADPAYLERFIEMVKIERGL